jgi:hypothetical protein
VQLRNKKSLDGSPKLIYVQKSQASGNGQLANHRHWFYVEESIETNLELIDVQPRSRWQKNLGMIATASEPGSNVTERSLTRFRAKARGCSDVVVLLEFTLSKGKPSAQCHVMTCSTDTDLNDLGWNLQYMRRQAFGKQGASNGRFNVKATVAERSVAGQPMFVLRLATAEALSDPTIDATRELSKVNLVLGFIKTVHQGLETEQKEVTLHEQQAELMADLQRRRQRLTVVEEEIRNLIDEKKVLEKDIHAGDSTLDQNVAEGKKLKQVQEALKKSERDYRTHLTDLLGKDLEAYSGPGKFTEVVAEMLVNSSDIKIDRDADFVAKLDTGSSQNTAKAAENSDDVHQNTPPTLGKEERETIVKLLYDESVAIVPEDWEGTALDWMAANGLKSVVQLHQQVQETRLYATDSKQSLSYEVFDKGLNPPPADEAGDTPKQSARFKGHTNTVDQIATNSTKKKGKRGSSLASFVKSILDEIDPPDQSAFRNQNKPPPPRRTKVFSSSRDSASWSDTPLTQPEN